MPDGTFTAAPGHVVRFPLDVDAIAARAQAAPGGSWAAFPDSLWIPFSTDADDPQSGTCDHGRCITVQENDWHAGSADPGPELWEFLATARDDVLALAAEARRQRAEVQRLRAALAAVQGRPLERAA
jgi:hypothetical protein